MNRRNSIEEIHRKTLGPWAIRERVSKAEEYGMYLHVFPEDVDIHILPYRSHGNENFQISVESDAIRDDLNLLLSVAVGEDYYSPAQALEKLVREMGMHLAFRGELYYELATVTKNQNLGGSSLFAPLFIAGKVIRIGNLYFQVVVNKENQLRVIFLNASNVWHIRLPKELGNVQKQRAMKRRLISAGKIIPDYLSDMQKNWLADKNYDAEEFNTIQTNLLVSSTQKWGWSARNLWREKALDYFTVYREIRFTQSLAILRSHIVTSFQELLTRVNIPCKIDTIGLMKAEELTKLAHDLREGNVSFENALNRIRQH